MRISVYFFFWQKWKRFFCRNGKADPHVHMKMQRVLNREKNLEKEKVGGLKLSDFKTYCKAAVNIPM